MIRHWWQSTFLLLALFALAACSGVAPDAESTSVEEFSMTPIMLTYSPEPSATPFPTETASVTPTPQPSLTATSESTATQEPTKEPTPTPTPEGPETYGLVFPQATDEQINAALEALTYETPFPLHYDPRQGGWELAGVLGNAKINITDLGGGYSTTFEGEVYYLDLNGNRQTFDLSLIETSDDGDRVRSSQMAMPRTIDDGQLIRTTYSGLIKNPVVKVRVILNTAETDQITMDVPDGVLGPSAFLGPIYRQIGLTEENLNSFIQTGDPSLLPFVDGRRFMVAPWIYPIN